MYEQDDRPERVLNPRPHGKGPVVQRLCQENTGYCTDGDFEFWAINCLNFVLKAGTLQPSIFWTILFVCTRSCEID